MSSDSRASSDAKWLTNSQWCRATHEPPVIPSDSRATIHAGRRTSHQWCRKTHESRATSDAEWLTSHQWCRATHEPPVIPSDSRATSDAKWLTSHQWRWVTHKLPEPHFPWRHLVIVNSLYYPSDPTWCMDVKNNISIRPVTTFKYSTERFFRGDDKLGGGVWGGVARERNMWHAESSSDCISQTERHA